MKTKLSFLLTFVSFYISLAQAPTIEGDTMLCPNTNGTAGIITDQAYDTYQWYYKYWFTEDPYVAIEGANGPAFTYDWYTYDQALLKVVVTLNGQTFESNTIQIDSYAWVGLTTGFSDAPNISINPENGNVRLCAGTTFTLEVFQPYSTNIRWYRNDVLLEGENSMTLQIHEPGVYHVVASPSFCPDNVSSSAGTPTIVEIDNTCELGVNPVAKSDFKIFPNPATDHLTISIAENAIDKIEIYSMTGQLLTAHQGSGQKTINIDVNGFSSGIYLLKVEAEGKNENIMFMKR
ncbi:MAG TPA: T9SS type A sorting domain-containing protein [Flavobacterium sp.]|jgi:hypothetical protein